MIDLIMILTIAKVVVITVIVMIPVVLLIMVLTVFTGKCIGKILDFIDKKWGV